MEYKCNNSKSNITKKGFDNLSFDCVAIVYNDDVEQSLKVANYIKEYLSKIGIVSQICSSDKLLSTASFAIVAGGDGTLLKVARYYAAKNVPIFGVNLGRLGFLAQVNLDGIDRALKKLLNSEYRIEREHNRRKELASMPFFRQQSIAVVNSLCQSDTEGFIIETKTIFCTTEKKSQS